MARRHFLLVARVSTDSPAQVRTALERLVPKSSIKEGSDPGEYLVEAEVDGESAKELNRSFLSALRRAEKKTRLPAEWTSDDTTERFFDHVPKEPAAS